jgi:hypothetical protein
MILVDFSQIMYARILDYMATTKQKNADIGIARKVILDSIRMHVSRFKREYGDVVVAFDAETYWRTTVFPHYKFKRKKDREKSGFNWDSIFACRDTLQKEFSAFLPYKVLMVEGCEADDIIGYLANVYGPTDKVMIVSGDKDFAQLQMNPNVKQYSPLLKKQIHDEFPRMTLKQQIIRGDSGDSIPNILSPDDVFVSGKRQSSIMEKKIIVWLNTPVETFCAEGDMLKNFKRNENLIDLRLIPMEVKRLIGHAYQTTLPATRSVFLNYLIANDLKELVESVEDF